MSTTPGSVEEVAAAVAAQPRVRVRGGGSKPAMLSIVDEATIIDMRRVAGIVDYDPGEYTFTALAGTPIAEVDRTLAQHGQGLPFDPPLVARGATLGGVVASGLSGSGRHRSGGIRDFILGVRFVDGDGRLVKGGGKVVKNAAGFDLPKLMVGSLGRLGVIVELSFKVFPRPEASGTLSCRTRDLAAAIDLAGTLNRSTWDIAALDVVVHDRREVEVLIRLSGLAGALDDRLARLRAGIGHGDLLLADADANEWAAAREFAWTPPGTALVKVPVTPARVAAIDAAVAAASPVRRYASGGQVAWIAWREGIDVLDARLRDLQLAGLVVTAPVPLARPPLLGVLDGGAFAARVTRAIDPHGRFA